MILEVPSNLVFYDSMVAKNKQQLPITVCWLVAEFLVFNPILPELILVWMVRCSAVSWLEAKGASLRHLI